MRKAERRAGLPGYGCAIQYRPVASEIELVGAEADSGMARIVTRGAWGVLPGAQVVTFPAHFWKFLKFRPVSTIPELRREEITSRRGARMLQKSLGRNSHHAY